MESSQGEGEHPAASSVSERKKHLNLLLIFEEYIIQIASTIGMQWSSDILVHSIKFEITFLNTNASAFIAWL